MLRRYGSQIHEEEELLPGSDLGSERARLQTGKETTGTGLLSLRQEGRGQGTAFKRMTKPLRIQQKLVRTDEV